MFPELEKNKIEQFEKFFYYQQDRLQDHSQYDDKSLNKILLLVSTGAFGLSINFFINGGSINMPIYLKISWACLALSMILNTVNYHISRNSKEALFKKLDNEILNRGQITTETYNKISNSYKSSFIVQVTELFNNLTTEFFVLGLVFLTIFAIVQI